MYNPGLNRSKGNIKENKLGTPIHRFLNCDIHVILYYIYIIYIYYIQI